MLNSVARIHVFEIAYLMKNVSAIKFYTHKSNLRIQTYATPLAICVILNSICVAIVT